MPRPVRWWARKCRSKTSTLYDATVMGSARDGNATINSAAMKRKSRVTQYSRECSSIAQTSHFSGRAEGGARVPPFARKARPFGPTLNGPDGRYFKRRGTGNVAAHRTV